MPAGGRGYTRPASLVSVWSTAPFLLNNTVGHFEPSPSVEARMRSFDDSIKQMLWPETRDKDTVLGDRMPGRMDRTTNASFLRVLANLVDPLLDMSKCPDFIVNRGHYFGTRFANGEPGLPDDDKLALIEFLKHF